MTRLSIARSALVMYAATVLAGLALVTLAGERFPGHRMGIDALPQVKRAVPDRTVGRAFLPHSTTRTWYPGNPRGAFDEANPLRGNWRFMLQGTSLAGAASFPVDEPARVRIDLQRRSDGPDWAAQLWSWPAAIDSGVPYRMTFHARASSPRSIAWGIVQGHPPWEGLGYYVTESLDTTWQAFGATFTVPRSDTAAVLQFNFGSDTASIELADIGLFRDSSSARVIPAPPSMFVVTHRFNRLGCRGPDPAPRQDSVARILVLGDSYAIGTGVRERETWSARLAGHLDALVDHSGAVRRFEVIACGAPGWGTRQARLALGRLASELAPDVVLLSVHWNDARLVPDESGSGVRWWPSLPYPLRPPEFLRLLPSPRPDTTRDIRRADLLREIQAVHAAVQSHGARFALVMLPHDHDPRWSALRDAVADLPGVPAFDLATVLDSALAGQPSLVYPGRDGHPNELVHAAAARALAPFLAERGLVPGVRTDTSARPAVPPS